MTAEATLSELGMNAIKRLKSSFTREKEREETFTTPFIKHELTFVDGDTETIKAHEFREEDGRISFRARVAPILYAHNGSFSAHSWFTVEVEGFGRKSIKNWDTEVIEDHEITIETEVFDGILLPKEIEIDESNMYAYYDEYTVVDPLSNPESE